MVDKGAHGLKDEERILSAVAYIGIISVIVYLLQKGKGGRHVLFHAVQGMLLFGCVFLADLLLAITVLGIILIPFVFLGYLALMAYMAYKAYGGERVKLPFIGDVAERNAG
jgi:uncharacterized membrane protein